MDVCNHHSTILITNNDTNHTITGSRNNGMYQIALYHPSRNQKTEILVVRSVQAMGRQRESTTKRSIKMLIKSNQPLGFLACNNTMRIFSGKTMQKGAGESVARPTVQVLGDNV